MAQRHAELDCAVAVAEEHQLGHTDFGRRLGLLFPTDRRHLRPRHGLVESAGLTVGHQAVGHLDTGVGQHRDGAGRPEVDVVRVGGDDERPLDLLRFQHGDQVTGARTLDACPTLR